MQQYDDPKLQPHVELVAHTAINVDGFYNSHPEEIQAVMTPGDLPIYKSMEDYVDEVNDTDSEIDMKQHAPALIEFAGRLCYMSFSNPSGRTNEQYIANIKNHQHFSVLQHGVATFFIENVDRALTHELIRHKHLSPSELSQRYVDRSDARVVVPPLYRSDPELMNVYLRYMEEAQRHYRMLVELTEKRHPGLKRKQIREAARRVLGEGFETKIVMTGNLQAWMEMLQKRYSVHADASILELAEEILHQLSSTYPAIFADVRLQTD